MITRFFNHASMHPVKTALYGGALILATPFVLPYLAPVLGASAVSAVGGLANLFGLTALGTGALNLGINGIRNIGPAFNAASQNSGKILLGGVGVGLAAPLVAPLLGSLGAPALALAGVFTPLAILAGASLLTLRLVGPLFKSPAPRMAPQPVPQHP